MAWPDTRGEPGRLDDLRGDFQNHVAVDRDWKSQHLELHERERKDRHAFTRNTIVVVFAVVLQIGVAIVLHYT